jgi:hypothetical protein
MIEAWTADEITPEFLAREMVYDAMSADGRYRVPMWITVTHFSTIRRTIADKSPRC